MTAGLTVYLSTPASVVFAQRLALSVPSGVSRPSWGGGLQVASISTRHPLDTSTAAQHPAGINYLDWVMHWGPGRASPPTTGSLGLGSTWAGSVA
jgi:hypothetical protein